MERVFKRFCWILLTLCCTGTVWAQLPHEVLLLVNDRSPASKYAANVFKDLRAIPEPNIVYLDIPEEAYGGTATITQEEFTKRIWEPANAAAQQRGIDGQILAWIYSVDFPIRVKTDASDRKQMSVGGVTFLRNKLPDLQMVEDGKYLSKLFVGPNDRLKLALPSISLFFYKNGLGANTQVAEEVSYLRLGLKEKMPLPNMMLGYIGENGNDIETVISMLQKGKQSDGKGQRDTIFFVKSDDVRSKCREWQYEPAVEELKKAGYSATVTTNFPSDVENVMGLLMGAETIDTSSVKSFAPGAVAEHLTSWSAEFQKRQTKMTDWIKAGASGSAGVVVEPYSNPNKFPNARFFVHYAAGCTMLESFYQSIACPLQNLLIGDPMARPFSIPIHAKVLGAEKISKPFTYYAQVKSSLQNVQFITSFLIDGKVYQDLSGEPSVYVDAEKLSDGYHELRANIHIAHRVNHASFVDKPFVVDFMGRAVSIRPELGKKSPTEHLIKVNIDSAELPEKVRLVCSGKILDEQTYSNNVELVLDEKKVGEGPNKIRVIATYADGMDVSSAPISFTVDF